MHNIIFLQNILMIRPVLPRHSRVLFKAYYWFSFSVSDSIPPRKCREGTIVTPYCGVLTSMVRMSCYNNLNIPGQKVALTPTLRLISSPSTTIRKNIIFEVVIKLDEVPTSIRHSLSLQGLFARNSLCWWRMWWIWLDRGNHGVRGVACDELGVLWLKYFKARWPEGCLL